MRTIGFESEARNRAQHGRDESPRNDNPVGDATFDYKALANKYKKTNLI